MLQQPTQEREPSRRKPCVRDRMRIAVEPVLDVLPPVGQAIFAKWLATTSAMSGKSPNPLIEEISTGLYALIAAVGTVGSNFSFARARGATLEAHFNSYCRLLPLAKSVSHSQQMEWLVGAVGIEFAVHPISPADSIALVLSVPRKMQLNRRVLRPRCGQLFAFKEGTHGF